ncbi:hypothetical protein ABEB36_001938 [Hypothenemus hampei]|uniref:Caspase-3 n=1 Tax=Hypothenemus hampei TaxID=57062 RepID=A0ABD1FGB5_HYPHA
MERSQLDKTTKNPVNEEKSFLSNIIPKSQWKDDECYDMNHKNRGIALIFNHQYFDNPLFGERRGTERDGNALEGVFKALGFHVEIYDDYTRNKIFEVLRIVSKMDHTDNDCLIVAILTHGKTMGRLFASDTDYTTAELFDSLSNLRCPTMAGKPKLFFLQACRGAKLDSGMAVRTDFQHRTDTTYTIPDMADILIMYSTLEGFASWRDTSEGSWFIQSLVKKLQEYHETRDLLSILTTVNRQVAFEFESKSSDEKNNAKKEMCSIVSMLTRQLFFR